MSNATADTTIATSRIHVEARARQDALKRARGYRRDEGKLRRRIMRAADSGNQRHAKHLIALYLDSMSCRFVASQIVNKRLPKDDRLTVLQLLDTVNKLNPRHGTDEPVRVSLKRKPDGRQREISAFGFKNRILQTLVLNALEAWWQPHPAQFNVRGRGIIDLNQALHNALATGLYTHFVQLDVKDCFPSFTAIGVAMNLPIPEQVTNAVVMMDNLNLSLSHHALTTRTGLFRHKANLRGSKGLPQGSICSAMIQNILLKPLLDKIPASAFAVMWMDNLYVLFRSEADAKETVSILRAEALCLSSGPLQLTGGDPGSVKQEHPFVGSSFQFDRIVVSIKAAATAKNKHIDKLNAVAEMPQGVDRDIRRRAITAAFLSRHRLWPDAREWETCQWIVATGKRSPNYGKFRSYPKFYRKSCFMA